MSTGQRTWDALVGRLAWELADFAPGGPTDEAIVRFSVRIEAAERRRPGIVARLKGICGLGEVLLVDGKPQLLEV